MVGIIRSYCIVVGVCDGGLTALGNLEKNVNVKIKNGWEPFGQISYPPGDGSCIQVMVRAS